MIQYKLHHIFAPRHIAVVGVTAKSRKYSLGIRKDSVLRYETALKSGKFILIAHGAKEDIIHAREILDRTGSETLKHHR